MPFTMKSLLEIDCMKHARLKAGKKRLHVRRLESVSVIEMPVENFVRQHEFVLTTAIGCGDDSVVFLRFVQDIFHSGAAGIAIATGRHVAEIPGPVLDFANEHDFPVIEVPWEIRFADVIQAVLNELHSWHRSILERSEEMQRRLLLLFLEGGSLSDAAEMITGEIGFPVLLADRDGELKGLSGGLSLGGNTWSFLPHTHDRQLDKELFGNADQWEKQHYIGSNLLCMKIMAMDANLGFMLLQVPESSFPFTPEADQMLEYTVTAAALWFQKEHAAQDKTFRLKDDFVWALAKEEPDSWDEMAARAAALDYRLEAPYVCILGYPEQLELLFNKSKRPSSSFTGWRKKLLSQIEEQMTASATSLHSRVMTTFQKEWFILFLEVDLEDVSASIKSYLDLLDSNLQSVSPELIMSWGIGENKAGIKTFHASFHTARIALEIGRKQKGPGNRSTYTNTSLYRTLLSLSSNTEIQEITLSVIGALIDYDNSRGLDLIHTLVIYIRNQGNASQTSRVMNLHRQSLLYRLKKIESLTGRSLEDPDDLFLLNLSIKLWSSGMIDMREG